MIIELPHSKESEEKISTEANSYAKKAVGDPDWLRNLTSEKASSALTMIIAHAEEDLLLKALPNIYDFMDSSENTDTKGFLSE